MLYLRSCFLYIYVYLFSQWNILYTVCKTRIKTDPTPTNDMRSALTMFTYLSNVSQILSQMISHYPGLLYSGYRMAAMSSMSVSGCLHCLRRTFLSSNFSSKLGTELYLLYWTCLSFRLTTGKGSGQGLPKHQKFHSLLCYSVFRRIL